MKTRTFVKETASFEDWLRRQCKVVADDLCSKHARMTRKSFIFLRATYYRWARTIEATCPNLAKAPRVLAVGDIHLENYGTWYDAKGRWIWGVNDFDEAAEMPYAFDLVRLATSIQLVPDTGLKHRAIADAILQGYQAGLKNPAPTFLDLRANHWIRPYVRCSSKCRRKFRHEYEQLEPEPKGYVPRPVQNGLLRALPPGSKFGKFGVHAKGGGSLGRPRYVVVASRRGKLVVREAKAIVPSAWIWAHRGKVRKHPFLQMSNGQFRSPDPFLSVRGKFLYRALAADERKIDFDKLGAPLRLPLIRAMGRELGSIHAATRGARKDIEMSLAQLEDKSPGWLHVAATAAAAATRADHAAWRKYMKKKSS